MTKKKTAHIYEGKDECTVEGVFPSENSKIWILKSYGTL